MERRMEAVIVSTTDDGMIRLTQEDADNIIIHPDQVDTLCTWLKEFQAKLRKGDSSEPTVKMQKLTGV